MNRSLRAPAPVSAVRRLRDAAALPLWAPAFVVDVWKRARGGPGVDVEAEARALAVLDHPEFIALHTHPDEVPDPFEVERVNPRVHLRLHQVVETQLIQNDPPEAALAMARLLGQHVNRHRAVHLLMDGLSPEIQTVMTEGRPADMDRYRRYLTQLSLARVAGVPARLSQEVRPKQQDPCPCGSGRLFRRCCGGRGTLRLIEPAMGRMVLGGWRTIWAENLVQADPGYGPLVLANLAAVAEALEQAGANGPAAATYRQLVAEAEAQGGHFDVKRALCDFHFFAMTHLEYAADGIWVTNRLLEQEEYPDQVAHLRLDLAELYEAAGDPAWGDALFRQVMAGDPPDADCHLRWARRLADAGELAEAEAVYRRVMERGSHVGDAALDLAQFLADQGRVDEAMELYRQFQK